MEERISTHTTSQLSLLSQTHSITAQPTQPLTKSRIHALSWPNRWHCKTRTITQTLLMRDDQPTPADELLSQAARSELIGVTVGGDMGGRSWPARRRDGERHRGRMRCCVYNCKQRMHVFHMEKVE